ncbi:MAG: hypothetical protein JSS83_17420 [Cyanobacteria bacterium SZAS LIN-3]|nr:hypothetical protein [Cyanobacteria bacterium SZAS LIN-3]
MPANTAFDNDLASYLDSLPAPAAPAPQPRQKSVFLHALVNDFGNNADNLVSNIRSTGRRFGVDLDPAVKAAQDAAQYRFHNEPGNDAPLQNPFGALAAHPLDYMARRIAPAAAGVAGTVDSLVNLPLAFGQQVAGIPQQQRVLSNLQGVVNNSNLAQAARRESPAFYDSLANTSSFVAPLPGSSAKLLGAAAKMAGRAPHVAKALGTAQQVLQSSQRARLLDHGLTQAAVGAALSHNGTEDPDARKLAAGAAIGGVAGAGFEKGSQLLGRALARRGNPVGGLAPASTWAPDSVHMPTDVSVPMPEPQAAQDAHIAQVLTSHMRPGGVLDPRHLDPEDAVVAQMLAHRTAQIPQPTPEQQAALASVWGRPAVQELPRNIVPPAGRPDALPTATPSRTTGDFRHVLPTDEQGNRLTGYARSGAQGAPVADAERVIRTKAERTARAKIALDLAQHQLDLLAEHLHARHSADGGPVQIGDHIVHPAGFEKAYTKIGDQALQMSRSQYGDSHLFKVVKGSVRAQGPDPASYAGFDPSLVSDPVGTLAALHGNLEAARKVYDGLRSDLQQHLPQGGGHSVTVEHNGQRLPVKVEYTHDKNETVFPWAEMLAAEARQNKEVAKYDALKSAAAKAKRSRPEPFDRAAFFAQVEASRAAKTGQPVRDISQAMAEAQARHNAHLADKHLIEQQHLYTKKTAHKVTKRKGS